MSLAQHLLDLHDQGASGWLQVTSRHGALGVVIHEGAPSASLRPGRAAESGLAARQALVEALTWVDAEVSFRVAATPPPIDRWSPHRLIIEATVRVFSEPELRAILDGVRHHRVVVAARGHGLVAEVTPPIAAAVARGMTVAELVEDVGRRVEGLAAIHGWVAMGILELLEPAPRTVVQQWRSSTTPPPRPVVIRRRQRPSPVPRVSTPPAVPRVSTPPVRVSTPPVAPRLSGVERVVEAAEVKAEWERERRLCCKSLELAAWEQARASAARLLELEAGSSEAELLMAYVDWASVGGTGSRQSLEQWAKRAIAADPKLGFAYFVLGELAVRDGRDEDGRRALRLAARLLPKNQLVHRSLTAIERRQTPRKRPWSRG